MDSQITQNPSAAIVREAKQIVATHCALCGRALKDALSVTMGIGPDCREGIGYDDQGLSLEAYEAINAAITRLAIARHEGRLTPKEILDACTEITSAGQPEIATGITTRLAAIHVHVDTEIDTITVSSPYVDTFSPTIKRACPGARWDKARKVWSVRVDQRNALWGALRRCYSGALGVGPKGPFAI